MTRDNALDNYNAAPSALTRFVWAQSAPIRDHGAWRALTVAVEHSDAAGVMWLPLDEVAQQCQMDVSELLHALDVLVGGGWLDRANDAERATYRLLMPRVAAVDVGLLPARVAATDVPSHWFHTVGADGQPAPEVGDNPTPTLFEGR